MVVLILAAAGGSFAPAGETPLSLYIVSGQSNAVGFGACFDSWCDPQIDVPFFESRISAVWIDLQPRPDGYFGPELLFGRTWADSHPGEAMAIFKYAAGGTTLCEDWDLDTGPTWSQFRSWRIHAMDRLAAEGIAVEYKGMLWMQGESDAAQGCAAEYEANLMAFIAAVRDLVGEPDLPFVIGEVNDAAWSTGGAIRTAQMNVAAADRNAGFVPTADLPFGADNIHFNTESQMTLGTRFATELDRLRSLSPADINGDGVVGVVDFLGVLQAWGPCPALGSCPADVDRSDDVGIDDFLAVLREWG